MNRFIILFRNELTILRNEMDRMQRREDAIRLKSFYEVILLIYLVI